MTNYTKSQPINQALSLQMRIIRIPPALIASESHLHMLNNKKSGERLLPRFFGAQ
jgi:hypothetical protein